MRKLLLFAALSLSACATYPTTTPSTAPVTYANQTKVDEQAATTAELAYKSWRVAAETGVKAGLIKGGLAAQVATLDNQLYAALQTVEAAYATGNADSIASAVGNFNAILKASYTVVGGR